MDMNFCRRCGAKFVSSTDHVFKCADGHTIYANASPAIALILENKQGQIVVLERAIDPGKGAYDLPGGFCDGAETLESAVAREIKEEVGVDAHHYTTPTLISTGIDMYELGGEKLPVLSCVFHAQLLEDTITLVADDDAASAEFITIDDSFAEHLYFDSLKEGMRVFLKQRTAAR